MKIILIALLLFSVGTARAETEDVAALRKEVEQLRSEVRQLKELLAPAAEPVSQPAVKSAAKDAGGFEFKSGEATLKIGGYAQFDSRLFERGSPGDSGFEVRRLRPEIRGKLPGDFGYRIQGDFAGSSARLVEGWMDWQACKYSKLTIGQFKEPFSPEAMTGAAYLDFLERSMIVSAFAPLFDVGAGASGKLFNDRVEYGAGIFNGRGANIEENNDDKDVAGRLVWQAIDGLYLGGSVTHGEQDEPLRVVSYRSAGRVPFFHFADEASSDGQRDRWGADIEWYVGPASIKAEWLKARQENVSIGTTNETAVFDGYSIAGSYFLTGEEKVRGKGPKTISNAGRIHGAWELVARYDEWNANQSLFDSGLATGTDRAQAATVGLNWYPNDYVRIMGNLVHVKYDDAITSDGDSADDENVALLRLQYSL